MGIYEIGPFQLDVEHLLLKRAGRPVALGPKVVETLLALVEHPGDVLAKGALLDRVWPEGFVEEANLAQNIHVLRKTFRHHGSADPIETVPRRGYRLAAPVRRLSDLPHERAPVVARTLSRRIAAIAGAAFVAACIVLVASYGFGHRSAAPGALSDKGARLYQIGRYYWNLRTRDGVQKSFGYFAGVIDTDPNDARGYAALADANVAMGDYCYGTHRPAVYFARAREYAKKALALEPNSAEGHAALGFLSLHRKDVKPAVAELRRAIALDPSYGPAHEWYGITLLRRGHWSEGLRQLNTAVDLDPLSVATVAWLGSAAYVDRRFGDAILYSRQALELSPKRTDSLRTIGAAYEAQGKTDRAIEAFKRYGAADPYYRPEAAALLAHAYALARRIPEARAELAYARAYARDVNATDLVAAAEALGERGLSLDMVRRVRGHETGMAIESAAHFGALLSDAALRQLAKESV
jgi:DNA-binding winged helix-turn-helix (wHTH) protein/Tfp pilus assembly protein PilF